MPEEKVRCDLIGPRTMSLKWRDVKRNAVVRDWLKTHSYGKNSAMYVVWICACARNGTQ